MTVKENEFKHIMNDNFVQGIKFEDIILFKEQMKTNRITPRLNQLSMKKLGKRGFNNSLKDTSSHKNYLFL